MTLFNGVAAYDTLVYVDDVYEVVATSLSPSEATTKHIEIVTLTGGRYFAV